MKSKPYQSWRCTMKMNPLRGTINRYTRHDMPCQTSQRTWVCATNQSKNMSVRNILGILFYFCLDHCNQDVYMLLTKKIFTCCSQRANTNIIWIHLVSSPSLSENKVLMGTAKTYGLKPKRCIFLVHTRYFQTHSSSIYWLYTPINSTHGIS